MVITNPGIGPRQELSLAIEQGAGSPLDLVTQKVLPDFPINRRTAHLIKLNAADTQARRIIADAKFVRAPGTKYERFSIKFADSTLTVVLRGVEVPLAYETQMDYDQMLDLEQIVCARLGQIEAYTKEYLRTATLTSTAIFGAATNSSVPYTTGNAGTNSFFADIISLIRARKAVGERPDTVIMSGPVFERLRQSVNLLTYLRGLYGVGIVEITVNAIQSALAEFGIKQVLVADSYYNNGAEGVQADVQMWPNSLIWVGKAGQTSAASENDGVSVPTMAGVGVTTFWEGWDDGGMPTTDTESRTFEGGNYVEIYPEKAIDSWIARLKLSATPYIGNPAAGALLATQYA